MLRYRNFFLQLILSIYIFAHNTQAAGFGSLGDTDHLEEVAQGTLVVQAVMKRVRSRAISIVIENNRSGNITDGVKSTIWNNNVGTIGKAQEQINVGDIHRDKFRLTARKIDCSIRSD